ncbi:MAG: hypothetical protein AB7L09_03455 [Nitrospira sp.]
MAKAEDSNPMYQPPLPPMETTGAATPSPAPWQQPQPVQVTEATFLAARLRESLAEAANLRQLVAELQLENSRLRAKAVQDEIDRLDKDHKIGQGSLLVSKADGTYWRMPQPQSQPQP